MTHSLSTRAIIVNLTISQWSGRRHDRKVTDEVNSQNNAAKDAGRYNKQLLPSDALEGINKVVSKTRADFLTGTSPWLNDGSRIMNAATLFDFRRWLDKQRTEFFGEVDKFCAAYPGYVIDAAARLNGMFNADDYPDATEIRKKFDMAIQIMPVPTADDFRVDMAEDQVAMIRAEIEESVNAASKAAMADVQDRVKDVVEAMLDRMTKYVPGEKGKRAQNTFKDSLVGNVRDLIQILPNLNITGSAEIDELAKKLDDLASFEPDALRISQKAREMTAEKAQSILDGLEGMMA